MVATVGLGMSGGRLISRTVTARLVGGLLGSIPDRALLAQWGRAFYM
jgi:hypothetical protein